MNFDEESLFKDGRKIARQERKRKQAKDRSKYKKSDQDKVLKKVDDESLLKGRVLSIISQEIVVLCDEKVVVCTLRGSLKKERGRIKNIVTVGDFVRFEKISDTEGVILSVMPRRSILSRRDAISQHREQVIASNIDQVLITGSVCTPLLNPALIDRYIIAARKGNMDPVILINKIDLLHDESIDSAVRESELFRFEEAKVAYERANIPLIPLSIVTHAGMDDLISQMKSRASVFSGQSGVGKSSLINTIANLDLAVGETVRRTKKGSHTTTRASLLPLEFGGFCIDTPGIKSFGLWDLQKQELEQYFREIYEVGKGCRFSNCTHSHEEMCLVKKAVKEGEISSLRYESYESLLKTINEKYYRR
ncbi:MAG: ribosome small subunit-dependent GTPase A [Waddliaceae bacterium]